MIKNEDITIIIPHLGETKEQEYSFDECFASLRESAPDIKIVVAKNGPACSHPRDIRIVQQGQNKAVNAAIAITNTPWVFITNDDMIYPPGWFDALVDPLARYSDILCISPKLIEPRPGAPTFEAYFCGGAGGDFDKAKFFEFVKNYTITSDPLRTGFNFPLLIKRELWDLIGGYDINYDPWGSNGDSDLEYKIKLAGVQPYQNTNAMVYHFSQTSGTFEPRNDSYRFKNYAYFEEKWGFPRTDQGIWEASFEIPKSPVRRFVPWWEGHYA